MAYSAAELFRSVTGWVYVLTVGNNAPPGGPTTGDRHVVGTAGSGLWSGLSNRIVRWDGAAWISGATPSTTTPGLAVYNAADNSIWGWSGAAWSAVLAL